MTDKQQGQRLRKLRKDRGLLLKFVASQMGIKSNYLSMLESGQKRWSQQRVSDYEQTVIGKIQGNGQ